MSMMSSYFIGYLLCWKECFALPQFNLLIFANIFWALESSIENNYVSF